MLEYAALVASPRALPDGLILVFQHPVSGLSGLRVSSSFFFVSFVPFVVQALLIFVFFEAFVVQPAWV